MTSPLRRLRDRVRAVGRRVQAAALQVLLVLLYALGFGTAHLWARLFHRRLLAGPAPEAPSFWRKVEPRPFDPAASRRQS
ncbi:MAG: hypothetical protein JXB39_02185 [Deltaproteobacteria bacterium]|nr:hypothetical protein [Deltaproteobacteria bacterium]